MSEVPESPKTRIETYLAGALGQAVVLPEPVTRLEQYLKAIAESGGGGGGLMPVIIYAESHTTVETYIVPVLTDAQITAAYNGIVAGKVVLIIDDMDTIAIQAYDASSIETTLSIRLLFTDKLILNYKEGGEIVATALAGGSGATTWGAITGTLANQTDLKDALDEKVPTTRKVNGKDLSSDVTLNANDVNANNSQSIQANLERIDDDVAIRQVTMNIDEWPGTLTEDFLYRVTNAISHGGKTYEAGLYQVIDNDLEKIGTGEAGETTWGSIAGNLPDQTDLQTALNGKANCVDGDQNRVQEANEIYTTTSQSQTDAFTFRTAAGAMSINPGPAIVSTLYGNTIQTGHTDEVLNATGNFQTEGTTVELDKATWRTQALEDGVYTFAYDGANWKLEDTTVTLETYGLTVSGTVANGDTILVKYTALVVGTLTTATPTSFKATGFNQYNATAGYAHVVGGNQYRVAGAYTAVEFATTPTGTKTAVTVENNKFTPEEDGYIFVTGSGNILVALVWSGTMDSEPWSAYSDNGFNIPTTDADGTQLPTATYGLPSVHGVRDEIDFTGKLYQQRIGHYAYSAENLATVEALGVDYIYDLNDIFYVLPDLVVYELASAVSGVYQVNDYGTEEWVGTSVPMTTVITYGNSLVDKLRNLADIQSIGTGLTLNANGELSAAGGAGDSIVKVLTTDDYNYPANNPTSVALWLLEPGIYRHELGVYVRYSQNNGVTSPEFIFINTDGTNQYYVHGVNGGRYLTFESAKVATGAEAQSSTNTLVQGDIANDLTSSSSSKVLSAKQGKVLKDLYDALEARVRALEGNA